MIIPAFVDGDPSFERVAAENPQSVSQAKGFGVSVLFSPDDSVLHFVGERHVPQLHLEGPLISMTPGEGMPAGVTGLSFGSDGDTNPPRLSMDYSFSTEQLKNLIDKGLYLDGFPVPEMFDENVWAIPATVDMRMVEPGNPGEIPLLSVDVTDLAAVQTDLSTTGYDFAEFFEDYRSTYAELEAERSRNKTGERSASASFGEDVLDLSDEMSEQIEAPEVTEQTNTEKLAAALGTSLDSPQALSEMEDLVALDTLSDTDTPDAGLSPEERALRESYREAVGADAGEGSGVGLDTEIDLDETDDADVVDDTSDVSDADASDDAKSWEFTREEDVAATAESEDSTLDLSAEMDELNGEESEGKKTERINRQNTRRRNNERIVRDQMERDAERSQGTNLDEPGTDSESGRHAAGNDATTSKKALDRQKAAARAEIARDKADQRAENNARDRQQDGPDMG